ncbi:MAG: efflux RND transporter permease subunit, partial [Candidatus Curtissbacteria bacterium]|nr:efflux RND transporter permease subunit [Candidatus Curtissbacteria bacterium]
MIKRVDRKLEESRISYFLSNPRLVVLLLILIISLGIYSFFSLPRNLNPQVNIPIVFVQTVLPGGSPSDIEQLVTVPLEEPIRGLSKVKTVTSSSIDSVSVINIEFQSGVDPDRAKSDVQSAVDSLTTLPANALTPKVAKLDFENQPVWTFNLTTEEDDGSLFRFAKLLQTKLKNIKEVNRVDISGLEDTEVEITIKPQTFSSYNINPLQLIPLVSSSLKAFPAGIVKTTSSSFTLNIDPQVAKIADIRDLRLNLGGTNIALGDIATIDEHPKPDQAESFLLYPGQNTKRSVTFNVYRTNTVNIDQAVGASEKIVNDEILKNPKFLISNVINTSSLIDDQFSELTRDFAITIILVVLVLFIFLGARQAIVSALSAPLSFLIAFIVMRVTGITLNFLSLFSLILSLGLLVDDTVVVMSAITSYFRTGRFTPLQSGLLVWRDFLIPIFTTTITTVWAFLPLLLTSGIIGEFIKSIPIVVSTALMASFLVSIFITLPLIIILLGGNYPNRVKLLFRFLSITLVAGLFYLLVPKQNNILLFELLVFVIFLLVTNIVKDGVIKNIKGGFKKFRIVKNFDFYSMLDRGFIDFERIHEKYQSVLEKILNSPTNRKRVMAMVLILFIFSLSLVPLGFVKNEFFPKTDQNTIYVSVELPPGTYVNNTRNEALNLIGQLGNTPELKFVTADIGRGFQSGMGVGSSSSNNVLFTLNLKGHQDRAVPSYDIAQKLRSQFASYDKGTLNVEEQSGGPPTGADVQIKITGDDLAQLDSYADDAIEYLKGLSGVTNVNKSVKPGTSKLTFVPDKAALTQNQIDISQIGIWLRLYASGLPVDKNKFEGENENIDITLRLSSQGLNTDSIYSIEIPTPSGVSVPLLSLGKIVLEPNPTLITREDGKRTISTIAAVSRGYNVADINKKLGNFADTKLNLAEGYNWKTGGANEQNQESVNSILLAMIFSFFLIIVTMVVQFNSFRRALVVMLVIPLS